ncbi:uncharacterized protein TNCT_365381 [Trichonephila clavata]|uniref:Uncharacterized protein n=1 Tax=Trichonephila clavata TaxID=2740835 RepID=A0A8X6L9I7_TRICU|nr:uncharacterized protein TNCT_365381 [Trichonephila clavata]
MEEVDSMKEHYNANLKAKTYNAKFNRLFNMINENFEFILRFLHNVVQSDRFKGSKVLEIGSGATVHNIASASAKYSVIVQSDYVMDNCEELKKWHSGESVLDWSQFLNMVLEIEGSKMTLQDLETRIRKSVKCVVRGDLLSDGVLDEQELTPETSSPYDLVISVLCIETAASNFEDYVAILKRINNLLRLGGGLVVCGYENGSPWKIGSNYFPHVKLPIEQISKALEQAGFKICELKMLPKIKSDYDYEYDHIFCVAAEKL